MRPAIRTARAVLWTVGLVAALAAADRLVLGSRPPVGWQSASTIGEVPPEAGLPLVPSYLPEPLTWPPRRIAWSLPPEEGWWVRIDAAGEPALWIGAGAIPPDLHPAGCLDGRGCPTGWRTLSRSVEGRPAIIVTNLPPHRARRVLDGLHRPL